MNKRITLQECPRPQFVRANWTSLNGEWSFKFDKENIGEKENYQNGFKEDTKIIVPFAYQTKASGIGILDRVDDVWYQKTLTIDKKENKDYILHLEGADHDIKVYLNGKLVGEDSGAYHRMNFRLTPYVKKGDNLLVIKCHDDYSCEKPRGKQRWRDYNYGCFYEDTTGIYKEVWLEEIPTSHICNVKITPLLSEKKVIIEYKLHLKEPALLTTTVLFDEKEIVKKDCNLSTSEEYFRVELPLPKPLHLWDVNKPELYDLKLNLKTKNDEDSVCSYFGLRECVAKDGFIYLNGKKLYQKLILDQGYFVDSDLTAPNNKMLLEDITKMQELGFNGCRKHQKVEDERFLYYADVLGYLMWVEGPSMYMNTEKSRPVFEREWMLEVKQHYNHPCVITWTPFNESWGIGLLPHDDEYKCEKINTSKLIQDYVNHIYYLTKEYDPYRFVITNDGWCHTISDILTIHHYEQDPEKLLSYFDTIDKAVNVKKWASHHEGPYAEGYSYHGEPIMFTEFGGTAYEKQTGADGKWGYGKGVKSDEEYIERLKGLFGVLDSLEYSSGYCYTQLSDVHQEVNGLVYGNREFKIDPKIIRAILDRKK